MAVRRNRCCGVSGWWTSLNPPLGDCRMRPVSAPCSCRSRSAVWRPRQTARVTANARNGPIDEDPEDPDDALEGEVELGGQQVGAAGQPQHAVEGDASGARTGPDGVVARSLRHRALGSVRQPLLDERPGEQEGEERADGGQGDEDGEAPGAPQRKTSQPGGTSRRAPSRNAVYQSGWLPAYALPGEAGPYRQTGLIVMVPAMMISTPSVIMNRPPARTATWGQTGRPTTGPEPGRVRGLHRSAPPAEPEPERADQHQYDRGDEVDEVEVLDDPTGELAAEEESGEPGADERQGRAWCPGRSAAPYPRGCRRAARTHSSRRPGPPGRPRPAGPRPSAADGAWRR